MNIDRRTVITTAGVLGVGTVTLTACGGSTDDAGASGGASAGAGGGTGGSAADAIKVADIPVGGGKVFDAAKVVVTQPEAGEFKAFSAICTHSGCTVNQVANGTIDCPCHGSKYDITTGAVTAGPAPSPLAGKTATVSGDSITIS